MKKIIYYSCIFLILSALMGFGSWAGFPILSKIAHRIQANSKISLVPSDITPINEVSVMIDQVSQDRLNTDLRRLTGVEEICLDGGCYTITDRLTGSNGLNWATHYVQDELGRMGYVVETQGWSNSGYSGQNLVVKRYGITNPNEEIYFVAHLDGVSGTPAADDNASGVADLLELARNLRHHLFNQTIVLLFSSGEEQGALGARAYVNKLTPAQLQAIKYMVDVDMISYDSNGDNVMELWNGEQPVDFVQNLLDIIAGYQINLSPEIYAGCN